MATPSINHGTLTHEAIQEANRRLDVIERQADRREVDILFLLQSIKEAQADAPRIIAQAHQLDSEVH